MTTATARKINAFDFGDASAPIGSVEWCKAKAHSAASRIQQGPNSDATLRICLDLIEEQKAYEKLTNVQGEPFKSMQEFLLDKGKWGCNVTIEEWEVFTAIRRYMPDNSVLMREAKPLKDKTGPAKGCDSPNPSGRKGKDSERTVCDGVTNCSEPTHGSNSTHYRAARLKRDHPETAARVEAGELTILDAEKELGIARVDRRITLPADPEAAKQRIIDKFGQEFFDAMTGASDGPA